MDFELHALMLHAAAQQHRRNRIERIDLFALSDIEFKKQFRFSKANVHKLVQLLHIESYYQELSPFFQVCVTLMTYAGHPFQRIAGLSVGINQSSVQRIVVKVTNKLILLRREYIRMPSQAEKADHCSEDV